MTQFDHGHSVLLACHEDFIQYIVHMARCVVFISLSLIKCMYIYNASRLTDISYDQEITKNMLKELFPVVR